MARTTLVSKRSGSSLLDGYDPEKLQVAAIASHSALDLFEGATFWGGLPTLALCQKGREKTYQRYPRLVQKLRLLNRFDEILQEKFQTQLRSDHVVLVPNRSLTTYVDLATLMDAEKFRVPLFGNRAFLDEGREAQRRLLAAAKIRQPERFKSPDDIDRPAIVKIQEAKRKHERAFFLCSSAKEFHAEAKRRLKQGLVTQADVDAAWIEEFVVGAQFNFNFFYSPLEGRLELLGLDRRIQTNYDGFLKLTADQQAVALKAISIRNIEVGHESVSIRESLLEPIFEMGEKLVAAARKRDGRGVIGPFALQGAIVPTDPLEIIIFDFSPRMPGSPVLYSSPYANYQWGIPMTSGRRVAKELKDAVAQDRLADVVS